MIHLLRIFAGACALLLMLSSAKAGDRITIFAAASLKNALDDVLTHTAQDVTVSYGGSGQIARQVALGAPADLIVLANAAWMDWLAKQDHVTLHSRDNLLGNQLVLIGPSGADPVPPMDATILQDRLEGGRLALGQTQSVPAGIYARQWLEHEGLWDTLRPHLAEVENVRAALALVSRGEAPLGVVYASDAMADPNVEVIYTIPRSNHDQIVFPMAVMDTKNTSKATEIASFLMSDPAISIFQTHGFQSLGVAQ